MDDFRFFRCGGAELVFINGRTIDFEEHSHSFDYVITCITGGSAVFTKDTPLTAGEGSIFSVKPYEAHSLRSDAPVSLVSFCMNKALFTEGRDSFCEKISALLDSLIAAGAPLTYDIRGRLIREAAALYDEGCEEDRGEQSVISSRESIENDPGQELDLDHFAVKASYSKYHFIRRFRKASGLTPHRFIIQNRIRRAQRMLDDGSRITETAVNLGFYDQSHFDKYFRKIVGMSPKEYISSASNFLQE